MKKILGTALLACGLVLAGCGNESSASAVSLPVVPSKPAACPSQDFERFLAAFADDVAVQKTFVTDPLQSDSVDADAEPEPQPVRKMLHAWELQFPLMPGTQQQARDGLKRSRLATSADEVTVRLAKEDTDYQMFFFFRKDGGCWKLYRLKNDSL